MDGRLRRIDQVLRTSAVMLAGADARHPARFATWAGRFDTAADFRGLGPIRFSARSQQELSVELLSGGVAVPLIASDMIGASDSTFLVSTGENAAGSRHVPTLAVRSGRRAVAALRPHVYTSGWTSTHSWRASLPGQQPSPVSAFDSTTARIPSRRRSSTTRIGDLLAAAFKSSLSRGPPHRHVRFAVGDLGRGIARLEAGPSVQSGARRDRRRYTADPAHPPRHHGPYRGSGDGDARQPHATPDVGLRPQQR